MVATELVDGEAERYQGKASGGQRRRRLPGRLDEIPDGPVVVYCAAGARSSIAASVLRRAGRRDVSDLIGGYAAVRGYGS